MANKQALRDFQSRLADRLQEAQAQSPDESWLAAECAGHGILLLLHEAGEIFNMTNIVPLPYSRPWFAGVANLRGQVHGVVDLAAYLGLPAPVGPSEHARLVGFNAKLDLNCALLVERLMGLRRASELTLEIPDPALPPQTLPAFAGRRLRDAQGRVWQELNLTELASDESFLQIVA